jgi:hypothetical protein
MNGAHQSTLSNWRQEGRAGQEGRWAQEGQEEQVWRRDVSGGEEVEGRCEEAMVGWAVEEEMMMEETRRQQSGEGKVVEFQWS